jgi:antitoxin component of RelBE/YafQ-DinJ toxin-antitoxin module
MKYTNIRVSENTRTLAKAVAAMIRVEYFAFIEEAIREKIVRTIKERNLPMDLDRLDEFGALDG